MSRERKVTLYFTEGSNPSDEELDEMDHLPGSRQRNASLIDPDAPIEKCDFVAGPAVPANYAAKYDRAKPLGAAVQEEEEETSDLTVAQLKDALDKAGVEYAASAKKAELIVLYDQLS